MECLGEYDGTITNALYRGVSSAPRRLNCSLAGHGTSVARRCGMRRAALRRIKKMALVLEVSIVLAAVAVSSTPKKVGGFAVPRPPSRVVPAQERPATPARKAVDDWTGPSRGTTIWR